MIITIIIIIQRFLKIIFRCKKFNVESLFPRWIELNGNVDVLGGLGRRIKIIDFSIKLNTFSKPEIVMKESEKIIKNFKVYAFNEEKEVKTEQKMRICYGRYNFILFGRVMHLTKSITISSNGAHNSPLHSFHFLSKLSDVLKLIEFCNQHSILTVDIDFLLRFFDALLRCRGTSSSD